MYINRKRCRLIRKEAVPDIKYVKVVTLYRISTFNAIREMNSLDMALIRLDEATAITNKQINAT